MSELKAMWALRIGQVCGAACERAVAEEVRGMLEDGLSREEVAREVGRVAARLVLVQLEAVVAAANDDEEREVA